MIVSGYMEQISNLVKHCMPTIESSTLRPKSFFIAWNAVPCLVFEGFPPPCVELKSLLNDEGHHFLKPENFGSKWPKVTLGYPSTPIQTVEDLESFKSICHSFQEEMQGSTAMVLVEKVSVVHYSQRSLEEIIECHEYRTTRKTNDEDDISQRHTPSKEQQDRVANVLSEWDDTTSYIENVRPLPVQPYREGSPSGVCCVIFLELGSDHPIMALIQKFRRKVDEAFPGRFVWMKDAALHCTIRAMDPKENCAAC